MFNIELDWKHNDSGSHLVLQIGSLNHSYLIFYYVTLSFKALFVIGAGTYRMWSQSDMESMKSKNSYPFSVMALYPPKETLYPHTLLPHTSSSKLTESTHIQATLSIILASVFQDAVPI